jgi:uncharacterized protein (TIGR02646 family)
LKQWTNANKASPNFNYDALPGAVKAQLKRKLLLEQGGLCAYTGREISGLDSHVEHLKPQSEGTLGDDVDYWNVVACFPFDGGDTSHGYGAPLKADWWDELLFVSPLTSACEKRFSFSWSGKVTARPKGNAAALETIARLGLDSRQLRLLRHSAIKGFFGFGAKMRPITKHKARALLAELRRSKPPSSLLGFCFVFLQLLPKYVPPRT